VVKVQARSSNLPYDPEAGAAYSLHSPRVRVIDLSRYFCSARICFAVVGGAPISSRSTSKAGGGGGSHDRHRGTHNGPGKKTELVILEPATTTILGLLYKWAPGGRIQTDSENTHRKSKLSE